MSFINIFVSKPCKIGVKNRQLHIENEDGDNSFSLSDLNSIMIESRQCIISSYALSSLAEANVSVFVCNDTHLPNGIVLPFNGYYKKSEVLNAQLDIPKPLKKQMWQSIIKRKIEGQARVLELIGSDKSTDLLSLSKRVASDDAVNTEATAAAIYFKVYLQGDVRNSGSFINSCLNYGYAIVRGLIARSITAYGFEPSIGLHHNSQLNAFNLVDDIIEPFRPIVDAWIISYISPNEKEMTTEVKRKIYAIVNDDVFIGNSSYTLSYAVELCVQSLKRSILNKKNLLQLPCLKCVNTHKYA